MYCTYRVQKICFNGKEVYYRLLLLVVSVTMHSRLVTTSNKKPDTNWWPKTEAGHWQICHNINLDLLSSSYVLSLVSLIVVMVFLWICYKLCVYLSSVSFRFVPMFIWICDEMQMFKIRICHNIHVVLSKAGLDYKLVYQLIWIFSQHSCRGLP